MVRDRRRMRREASELHVDIRASRGRGVQGRGARLVSSRGALDMTRRTVLQETRPECRRRCSMRTRPTARLPVLALVGALLLICPPGDRCAGRHRDRPHHRRREGHLLPVRPEPPAPREGAGGRPLRLPVAGLHREHLRRVPAARHAAGHRPVRRARLRVPGAVRRDAQADRQEDEDGLPPLQRGDPPARAKRHRRLRRPGRPAGRDRARGERHLPDRAAALQGLRGAAEGDGADRHRPGARRAEGRAHRRHVLRGRVPGEAPDGRGGSRGQPDPHPDHEQEHHRVLPAGGDPRRHLRLAAARP